MARTSSSPLRPGETKLQRRAQKYRGRRQRLSENRRNDKLASDRLQQDSQERQRRLSRDAEMIKEELAYACLHKSVE